MARISKYTLDKDLEKEIFSLFWSSLSTLKTSKDMSLFFSDLLSDTEEVMLAKRFAIALLLKRGKNQTQISKILHVSFSMIKSVNEWISHASLPTNVALQHAQVTQTFEAFFDSLTTLLDKKQPRYGTDWHHAGVEKWKRMNKRTARKILR